MKESIRITTYVFIAVVVWTILASMEDMHNSCVFIHPDLDTQLVFHETFSSAPASPLFGSGEKKMQNEGRDFLLNDPAVSSCCYLPVSNMLVLIWKQI